MNVPGETVTVNALALLMLPLVPMPLWLRNLVWYLITIVAIVVAFRLCEMLARRLYPGPWTQRELLWLRGASVLLISKFILAVLENQAHDALPLVLMLGGLLALAASRPLAGGAALGCAAHNHDMGAGVVAGEDGIWIAAAIGEVFNPGDVLGEATAAPLSLPSLALRLARAPGALKEFHRISLPFLAVCAPLVAWLAL